MQLSDITPAIARIAAHPVPADLRATGYLLTYPHLCALATPGTAGTERTFLQLAAATYGWMPRVLQVDAPHLARAVAALQQGATATPQTAATVPVQDIAAVLHSVVGASKMLHFVNNAVFPIWDSRIETFRRGARARPSQAHMDNVGHYHAFVAEVHAIRAEPGFPRFYADFLRAYDARQHALGIPPYAVTEVRAIEAAAFELS